jgi:hypothetical protein
MKKLTLRLTDTLHAALKQLSGEENRSLHGEIVYHLRRVIENGKQNPTNKESDDVERQRSQKNR